jgi:hypothetical protein
VQLSKNVTNLMGMIGQENDCFERNDAAQNRLAVGLQRPGVKSHKRLRRHDQELEQDCVSGFDLANGGWVERLVATVADVKVET